MEQISANESGTIYIGQNEFFASIDNLVKAKELTACTIIIPSGHPCPGGTISPKNACDSNGIIR